MVVGFVARYGGCVQRVLDIDVDFFVEPTVYDPDEDDERPDPNQHTVWPTDTAMAFLREQCGLVNRTRRVPYRDPRSTIRDMA
jgi:hypothetical protein